MARKPTRLFGKNLGRIGNSNQSSGLRFAARLEVYATEEPPRTPQKLKSVFFFDFFSVEFSRDRHHHARRKGRGELLRVAVRTQWRANSSADVAKVRQESVDTGRLCSTPQRA